MSAPSSIFLMTRGFISKMVGNDGWKWIHFQNDPQGWQVVTDGQLGGLPGLLAGGYFLSIWLLNSANFTFSTYRFKK